MMSAHVYDVYLCELVAGVEPPYGESPVPVVVLKTQEYERYLPLFLRTTDAHAIAGPLQGLQSRRPMTHDLIVQLLERFGHRVESVIISRVEGPTYYATLRVTTETGVEEFDCRPSDALAIAIRLNAPIVIAPELLERLGSTAWDASILQNAVPGAVTAITPVTLTKT